MTRRGALLATMMLAGGQAVLADQEQQYATIGKAWEPKPAKLSFDFTDTRFGITALEVKFPGKTITITAEALRAELEGVK